MREILMSKQLRGENSTDDIESSINFIQNVWSKVKQLLPIYGKFSTL